ncbi:MAG TPA: 50S ribosomal protein L4 [Candidatus Saccharimonadales bacterium]|nr:50S ribosomal protein L4 [Candidatus Saccharimonadales bacterium]
MAQATLYSKTGTKKETPAKLSAKVFAVEANHELLGLAYRLHQGAGRVAGAHALTRGEVRGGGKKPWKQKGTGRARAGGTRLPHWTGGGKAFGPTGLESHTGTLPVKAKRAAVRQALSLQAADKKIMVLETFACPDGKVKPTLQLLEKIGIEGNVLIVVSLKDALVDRATRNIPEVKAVSATYLNVVDILNADAILISQEALEQVNAWLEADR